MLENLLLVGCVCLELFIFCQTHHEWAVSALKVYHCVLVVICMLKVLSGLLWVSCMCLGCALYVLVTLGVNEPHLWVSCICLKYALYIILVVILGMSGPISECAVYLCWSLYHHSYHALVIESPSFEWVVSVVSLLYLVILVPMYVLWE